MIISIQLSNYFILLNKVPFNLFLILDTSSLMEVAREETLVEGLGINSLIKVALHFIPTLILDKAQQNTSLIKSHQGSLIHFP